MHIALNDVFVRLIMFWNALNGHPDARQYMRPALLKRVEALVLRTLPLMAQIKKDDTELAAIEQAFDEVHRFVMRMHHGVRFTWFDNAEALALFGTLNAGTTPEEDKSRLVALVTHIPTLKDPEFAWPKGLTLETCKAMLKRQEQALKQMTQFGKGVHAAAEELRELRPEAHELWDTQLDPWLQANVQGHEEQIAWGRERRRRPRKSAEKPAENKADNKAENKPKKGEGAAAPTGKPAEGGGTGTVTEAKAQPPAESAAPAAPSPTPVAGEEPVKKAG